MAATEIVDTTKQMLFNNNESTFGKSAMYPQKTRPNVFVIPIIDSKNDAEFCGIPYQMERKEMCSKRNFAKFRRVIL